MLGPAAVACGPAQGQPGTSGAGQAQGQPAAGQAVKGGTFTDRHLRRCETMQPLLAQDTASSAYVGLHYNAPLLRRNEDTLDLDTKYGTAQSYTVSPDGLTLTFKMKPNVLWSDGSRSRRRTTSSRSTR